MYICVLRGPGEGGAFVPGKDEGTVLPPRGIGIGLNGQVKLMCIVLGQNRTSARSGGFWLGCGV